MALRSRVKRDPHSTAVFWYPGIIDANVLRALFASFLSTSDTVVDVELGLASSVFTAEGLGSPAAAEEEEKEEVAALVPPLIPLPPPPTPSLPLPVRVGASRALAASDMALAALGVTSDMRGETGNAITSLDFSPLRRRPAAELAVCSTSPLPLAAAAVVEPLLEVAVFRVSDFGEGVCESKAMVEERGGFTNEAATSLNDDSASMFSSKA